MPKSQLLLAAAAFGLAAQADAAVVTQSFTIAASGFEAGAPIEPVTGSFTFTYDNAALLTLPSPVGLTVSGFNVPYAGNALFSFNKGADRLTVGTNIGFSSYSVSPATPGFGFFLLNASATPSISSFAYSANGRLWNASRIQVMPAGAVPEPGAWAMMIAGFGLAGAALRASRRGRSAATATA